MKLYCTKDEVSINGSVLELQEIKSKIEAMKEGDLIQLQFDTTGNTQGFDILESTMIIRAGSGPSYTSYQKGIGITFTGGIESLKAFASLFNFEEESELGCHYHWDDACDSNYVASGTLPITVAVS
ncbi:MAG: hypothetical protein B0W54_12615 [Cellvibrio sp. 79]|nr:MAG: hypothetical protein B0W54_12615 [Cellvibrio sp. 79]